MAGRVRVRGGGSCNVEYYVKTKKKTKDEMVCSNKCHDADSEYVRIRYQYRLTDKPLKYKYVNCWFKLEKRKSKTMKETYVKVDWYVNKPSGRNCKQLN